MAVLKQKPKLKPKARLGRPKGQFTQHSRLSRLWKALEAAPSGLNIHDLAAAMGVTTRSVRRYLEYLVKRESGLETVPTRPGAAPLWRIKPIERGRALFLRRTQAYGLLAARRIFDVMRGSALYDELDLAARDLVRLAQRPTKGEIAGDKALEDRLLYVPEIARIGAQKGEELDDVFRAVADLRVLTFRYQAAPPRRGAQTLVPAERVQVHPYAMILHKGSVHCVGLDVAKDEIKAFLLDRMSETRASEGERFHLPEEFRVADFLQGEFGVGRGPTTRRVLIEFEPSAAEDVRSRRVHPSQKIAAAADGRVRLSMTLGDLEPVAGWVLGFGSQARVIEPAELRAAVVQELKRAMMRYGE
jgi:predicted DNA-binding transcriptional regulator YafY